MLAAFFAEIVELVKTSVADGKAIQHFPQGAADTTSLPDKVGKRYYRN